MVCQGVLAPGCLGPQTCSGPMVYGTLGEDPDLRGADTDVMEGSVAPLVGRLTRAR